MISLKLQAMTSDAKINEIKKKFLVYNAKLIELQVWQKWVTTGAEHTLAIMRANSKKKKKNHERLTTLIVVLFAIVVKWAMGKYFARPIISQRRQWERIWSYMQWLEVCKSGCPLFSSNYSIVAV